MKRKSIFKQMLVSMLTIMCVLAVALVALAKNPSILSMDTQTQTSVLADCVADNFYLELLYIQGVDGMQTGCSSGELADRSTRWWFTQTMADKSCYISCAKADNADYFHYRLYDGGV